MATTERYRAPSPDTDPQPVSTRSRILDVSERLVQVRGYNGFSYADVADALATIDAEVAAPPAKLATYAGLYAEVLREERMCLCGMLAAEYQTLPSRIRDAVIGFLDRKSTRLNSS